METGGSVEWSVSVDGASPWRREVVWSASVSGGGASMW